MGNCSCGHEHALHNLHVGNSNNKCSHIYNFNISYPIKNVERSRPIYDSIPSTSYSAIIKIDKVPVTKTRVTYTKTLTSRWVPNSYNNSGGYYVQDEHFIPKTETYTEYVDSSYNTTQQHSTSNKKIVGHEKYVSKEYDYTSPKYGPTVSCQCKECRCTWCVGSSYGKYLKDKVVNYFNPPLAEKKKKLFFDTLK